jgi:hypothetical protein
LVTFGIDELVPYGLALVGAASLAGTLVLAIALRDRLGWKTWLLTANPAIYLGFAGDTSEPLGALLLALALANGSILGVILLGVTRPTYLLGLITRWKLLIWGVGAAVALGGYSLWRFGLEGAQVDGGRIGPLLTAYFENPSVTAWVLVVSALVTVILGLRARDWAWVLGGLFVLSFGHDVTLDPVNALRAAGFLPILWGFGPGYVLPTASSSEVGLEAHSLA